MGSVTKEIFELITAPFFFDTFLLVQKHSQLRQGLDGQAG